MMFKFHIRFNRHPAPKKDQKPSRLLIVKLNKKLFTIMVSFVILINVICIMSIVLVRYSDDITLLEDDIVTKNEVLNQTTSMLMSSYREIHNLTDERNNLTDNLVHTSDSLNVTISCLNDTRTMLQEANNSIADLQTEIAAARRGDSYHLHDPTYAEMKLFLEDDQTDKRAYDSTYYLCRHFAKDLRNNASKAGLRCAYVEFYGSQPADNIMENQTLWRGHAMVAFDTPDAGLVYIEPQNDNEINITMNITYMNIYIQDLLVIW